MRYDDNHIIFFLDGANGDGKVLTDEQAQTLIAALQHVLRF